MYNIVMAKYDVVQYYFKITDKMVETGIKRLICSLASLRKLRPEALLIS